MTLDDFRQELERRGDSDVWVVCIEDTRSTGLTGRVAIIPRAAFWTRGEAYSFAHARHAAASWHHAYVFRLWADRAWAAGTDARELTFETVFTASTGEPRASLTPNVLAALFGA